MTPPSTTPRIRVLLADDHPVIRMGLSLMLQYEPDMEAVAQASNGREAVEQYALHRPDVVLMDLRMADLDGADATAAICATFPTARIILFSAYDGDEGIYRGLRAGAKAYLLKDVPSVELLETIRIVAAGQTRITAGAGARLVEHMAGPKLTDREREVLRAMARGLSNKEIAAALSISEGTVKFHVNHILNKLQVGDRTQAVLAALRRGLASLS
jgi:DNA-binding NarL/FixJ family response regulator